MTDNSEADKSSPDHDIIPEEKQEWYSIKEAAEYLGISQPTIFRWMKDGSLSYYKVGGSTRFTRENLEAVVEKTTGTTEARIAHGCCAACGNSELVDGTIQGISRLYFRPAKTKFWTLSEGLVPITARVCPACGYVQMNATPKKLASLLPEKNDSEERDD